MHLNYSAIFLGVLALLSYVITTNYRAYLRKCTVAGLIKPRISSPWILGDFEIHIQPHPRFVTFDIYRADRLESSCPLQFIGYVNPGWIWHRTSISRAVIQTLEWCAEATRRRLDQDEQMRLAKEMATTALDYSRELIS